MTGKRNSAKQIANKQCKTRLKWTEAMNTKLLKCKRQAKDFCTVEGPSEEGRWKKQGYMAIMKQFWDNREFADLRATVRKYRPSSDKS